MTIGVDIRVLANEKDGGVYEYASQLLSHMVALDSSILFKLFYSSFRVPAPSFEWMKKGNVSLHAHRISNSALFLASYFQQPKADLLIGGVDVFFSPHILSIALSPHCPRTVTFHDLSYERFPEFFSWRRRLWNKAMGPKSQAQKAKAIIAVSESTKRDLENIYRIPSSKISVIHSGVGGPEIDKKEIADLPAKYILALSTLEPRKNISGVIKAFEILKEDPALAEYHLVIVGPSGWLYESILDQITHSPQKNSIHCQGFASKEKSLYYQNASCLVYPSFFEGFGFPPLEAMAHGVPAIVGLNSSMPEVVGQGGMAVNPYSPKMIAQAVASILRDPAFHKVLKTKAEYQAQKFSWPQAAEKTLELLLKTSTE
ncbi:MAG TPA: glycosyltransferase family 1 protein [Candidatus Paceibacterota bacterium]